MPCFCSSSPHQIWSIMSSVASYTLPGHDKGANSVCFYPGPDKPYLVSGGDDGSARIAVEFWGW